MLRRACGTIAALIAAVSRAKLGVRLRLEAPMLWRRPLEADTGTGLLSPTTSTCASSSAILTGVGAIRVNADGLGVAFCDCSGVLPWLDADGGRATVPTHAHRHILVNPHVH
jgi:hypothetical protein